MIIGKSGKIALIILSILPILYMFFFMAFIFITMLTSFSGKAPSKDVFDFFPVVFIAHFAVILLSFALLAFYIYYLFKTERVAKDKKALWAVILFLGSFFCNAGVLVSLYMAGTKDHTCRRTSHCTGHVLGLSLTLEPCGVPLSSGVRRLGLTCDKLH